MFVRFWPYFPSILSVFGHDVLIPALIFYFLVFCISLVFSNQGVFLGALTVFCCFPVLFRGSEGVNIP